MSQKLNIKKTIKKRIDLQQKSDKNRKRISIKPDFVKNIPVVSKEVKPSLNLTEIELNTCYDICVIITTYNREKLLKRLLADIDNNKLNYNILVAVFDDASFNKFSLFDDIKHIRYNKNHGKIYYWKLITDTMQFCKQVNSKYYIYLPDDVTLVDNFFFKAIEQYEGIKEENKICLSLLLPKQLINKTNWTDFIPIEYDSYYKTQWCDLCFISEKKLFEAIDYKINQLPIRGDYKNYGSGVGLNMSMRLFKSGYNMYHTKESLALHGDHTSVMNHEIRINNKLTT
jgi:hypothetical protein